MVPTLEMARSKPMMATDSAVSLVRSEIRAQPLANFLFIA
jgi:hypothetical protein